MTCSMSEDDQRQKLRNYAYFYLNIRPRTVREVHDYLVKKAKKFTIPVELIDPILTRFLELKLLDDHEFVRWYVEGKYASSQKSVFLLRQELTKVGVPKDIIDEFFSEYVSDDSASAREALSPKWRRMSEIPDQKMRFQKAASFLSRKGFSYDIIKKTIAEYEGGE